MKLRKSLLVLPFLFSTPVFASDYNVVVCRLFNLISKGWTVGTVVSRENHSLGLDQVEFMMSWGNGQRTSASCGLITGKQNDSLEVSMFSATAESGIRSDRKCAFTGKSVVVTTAQKTIGTQQHFFSDLPFDKPESRLLIYLADPSETTSPDWGTTACQKIASRMPH